MRASALTGAAAAAVALAVVLSGCGSDKPAASSSSSSSSSTSSSSASSTSKKPKMTAPVEAPAGPNPTIADYVKENGIQETVIQPGDTSAPAITIPIPSGWENALAEDLPPEVYGGAIYSGAEFADDAPQIQALYVRLTGDVDPQQILNLAPGELSNFPGYTPMGDAGESTLGEFPAYQLAGSFEGDGGTRLIAQKTAVIPGDDGNLYVLQLNVAGPEAAKDVLGAATEEVDKGTTIG